MKVGDKVKVKEDLEIGKIYDGLTFGYGMQNYKGEVGEVVEEIPDLDGIYFISLTGKNFCWNEKMLEVVEKFEVGEKAIYEDALGIEFDCKILYIAEEKDELGQKYLIKFADNGNYALTSGIKLLKKKKKDELKKGDRFIEKYGDESEYKILAREYDEKMKRVKYFCKREDGYVCTLSENYIKEVVYNG